MIFISSASLAEEFTARTLGDYGNVTVMEVTGNYDANRPDGPVNDVPRQAIAREFFNTHKGEGNHMRVEAIMKRAKSRTSPESARKY